MRKAIDIDLAKNVFALHSVNRHGKTVLVKPHIRRDQLLGLLAQLPPYIVGRSVKGYLTWRDAGTTASSRQVYP